MVQPLKYRAAIIGLGSIGQGYDYECADESTILTHASAYSSHDGYELVAGVDPSPEARGRFERKYHKQSFPSVEEMFCAVMPDVVSICVPTSLHWAVFREVIRHDPRAIVCEKPLATTLDQGQEVVDLAHRHGCALLVNYMRRFDPGINRLRDAIGRGEYGLVRKGVVWYSKGILNNGSHFIDLLSYVLGDVDGVTLLTPGRKFPPGDHEPDVCITFAGIPVYFLAVREEDFSAKEIELVSSDAVINIESGGERVVIRRVEASALFPSYRSLSATADLLPTDLKKYQYHVVESLYRHLAGGAPLASNGDTALATLKTVEQVKTMTNIVDQA